MELIDKSTDEAFLQLAATIDRFERYENPHAVRIAVIADEIAKVFHLARHDRGSLRAASLLHDLGEVAMEREYIRRTDSLSDEDRLDLARQSIIGEREASRIGADRAAQLLVRWHHEWWNGQGYPDAMRGDDIPLAARILRLADSYAALTDARPFRPALRAEAATAEIVQRAGIEFDPSVVDAFLVMTPVKELESFAKSDLDAFTEIVEAKQASWNLFSS